MAVGMSITNEPGNYNGRMTPFVVLSCMMAAMGGLIFGYDIGISGGVTSMEPFLKRFFPDVYTKMKEDSAEVSNYCKFDSELLTLFTSSLYIAGLFASLLASSVTRACGRTPSILIGGVAFLAGAALGSGVLIANLINYGTEKIREGWGWRISLGLAAVPAAMLTLGGVFLPETANSLIQRRNDHDRAKRRLQRVRGTDDVQAELDDLVAASEVSRTIKRPFKNILQRRYRPQLVMSIAIPFFQQVTGINVIASYAPVLFRTIGLGESASLMSAVVTGAVGLFTTFVSMLIVDKLGRRRVLIIGGILMFLTQMTVGGVMAAKLGNHGGLTKGWAISVLLLICIYDAGFGFSWGPLGWLIPSEIFPLEIRSAGQSITVAVNFFFTFLVGQTFLAMLCHFKYGIFFFYGGWVAVMTTFVYFLLPETKNMPIEKMDVVWRDHWFWKKFAEVKYYDEEYNI
nr:hexose carrier protein HEX6-like [Ipomoea batatas]